MGLMRGAEFQLAEGGGVSRLGGSAGGDPGGLPRASSGTVKLPIVVAYSGAMSEAGRAPRVSALTP